MILNKGVFLFVFGIGIYSNKLSIIWSGANFIFVLLFTILIFKLVVVCLAELCVFNNSSQL